MDLFQQVFHHVPENKMMICWQACHIGVVPDRVETHLASFHKNIHAAQRKAIVNVVWGLPDLAWRPSEVILPNPNTEPIEDLDVYHDGLVCTFERHEGGQCLQILRERSGLQKHSRNLHNWLNPHNRGGDVRNRSQDAYNGLYRSGRSCQRLFRTGGWPQYVAVRAEPSTSTPDASSNREEQADAILTQCKESIVEARSSRAVEDDSNRLIPNAWLAFTGWAGHLSKFKDKEQIRAYIQPAGDGDDCVEEDIGLEDACRGTRRLIRAAFQVCKADIVGKAALESANRRETGAVSNEKPFYAGHQKKTIRKYSDVFVSKLRYLWKTAQQETKPKYFMTKRQLECLEKLRDVAAPEKFGKDFEGIRNGSIAARKESRRQTIEDASMVFWIAMFDHELKDSEFKSSIISGLAVFGIDTQNGSWKTALNYTPILSAIVTVMRALVVYRAWQMRQQSIQNGIAAGLTQEEAENKARSVVEGVDKLVERFMTLRKFGGRISPMDRILHMRTNEHEGPDDDQGRWAIS